MATRRKYTAEFKQEASICPSAGALTRRALAVREVWRLGIHAYALEKLVAELGSALP
jgi:hypothetical protein